MRCTMKVFVCSWECRVWQPPQVVIREANAQHVALQQEPCCGCMF